MSRRPKGSPRIQPTYVQLTPEARAGVARALWLIDEGMRHTAFHAAELRAARAWIAHQVVRTDRRAENRRAIKAGYDTPGTVAAKMQQARVVVNAFDSFFGKKS